MDDERRNGTKEFLAELRKISESHAACSARVAEQVINLREQISAQHEEIKSIMARQTVLNGKAHDLDIKITRLTTLAGIIGGAISLMGQYLLEHLF